MAGKSEVLTWGNILLLDFFWFSRDSVESTKYHIFWLRREERV